MAVNNRPEQSERDEQPDARRARRRLARVRRRPTRAIIVHTGEGRAFQTGVDLQELSGDGVGVERYRDSVEQWDLHFTAWHQHVRKPVVAAVNGFCAGGGLHFVADADIVIAASDAQFLDPHVSVGQVTAIESIGLARKMPFEAVMRMALLGRHERMSAARAYELGMVSQVVDPPDQLRAAAQELAEAIARNSPSADAGDEARAWKARSSTASRTAAGPALGSSSRCGAIPIRPRGRWHSPEKRGPRLERPG